MPDEVFVDQLAGWIAVVTLAEKKGASAEEIHEAVADALNILRQYQDGEMTDTAFKAGELLQKARDALTTLDEHRKKRLN